MKWHGTSLMGLMSIVSVASLQATAMARPLPMGISTVTVRYETYEGVQAFSAERDFNGVGPVDAAILSDAPNIKEFNAVNTFGRRTDLSRNPNFAAVLGEDESLIAHAFFKINNADDFYPGLLENGRITLSFHNIHFAERVHVHLDTLLIHVKWNDQNKELNDPYIHIDDHHTFAAAFRDIDSFLASGFFAQRPVPNYVLADPDVDWLVVGDGTDTLDISVSFPYRLLRNFEETGQPVPDGLPAPEGFLEPFHFHVEYVVSKDTRPPVEQVQIDFDPTQCPNQLDKRSRTTDVVVVGTEQFPVWRINLVSLALSRADGQGGIVLPKQRRRRGRAIRFEDITGPSPDASCECPDSTPDGILDRVVTFDSDELVQTLELGGLGPDRTVALRLNGRLIDGTAFEGIDCVLGTGRQRR